MALAKQPDLKDEEFVEGQPVPGALQRFEGVREMDLNDGCLKVHDVRFVPDRNRQVIGQAL